MVVICKSCGVALNLPDEARTKHSRKVKCPGCEQVAPLKDGFRPAPRDEAATVKMRIVPVAPPVSGELAKTRQMSTSDIEFLRPGFQPCSTHKDKAATHGCGCGHRLCAVCAAGQATPPCPGCSQPMSAIG